VRAFNIFPHNQPAIQGNSQWVTLVLVKEGGEWGIAHTHQSAYGGNYDRLQKLKTRYDPDNVFHLNQNITPG
jgi:FAD/FMN-containing dehydrogenase